jgi:hypothetical protein
VALDDQIRETVNRLLDSLRGRLESDFATCQDELVRAAQDASARIASDAAEGATAEARREAEQQLTEARESAARDAEEQRARLTADIEDLQRRLDEAREDAQRRLDESQVRIDEGQQQIVEGQQQIEGLRNELDAAREELDQTRDDVEATLQDIETLRRDSDAVRVEVSRLTDVLRRTEERMTQAVGLPDAVRALDEASTFGAVLEDLARSAGREAGRAAVFLVKGNRLRDWRTVGFDIASDAPRLDIELSESGLMAEAVRSGESVGPHSDNQVPDFARTDEARDAAAYPVSVGGSVVAVLYADSPVADNSNERYWPAFLEVLARHAGRVLEGITVRQAAGLTTGQAAGISSSSVRRQSSGSIQ